MFPDEFFMACYRIPYKACASIGDQFGEPMNCYGFIYWFYKLCLGIELERGDVKSFDNVQCVTYNEVDKPQNGDVVWLRTISGVFAVHVGLYWNGNVYHFTSQGLHCMKYARAVKAIKGIFHVVENTQRDIQSR